MVYNDKMYETTILSLRWLQNKRKKVMPTFASSFKKKILTFYRPKFGEKKGSKIHLQKARKYMSKFKGARNV